MSDFKVDDRVQDVIWDGAYTGDVVVVDEHGRPYVLWDGETVPELMMPLHVVRIDEREAA